MGVPQRLSPVPSGPSYIMHLQLSALTGRAACRPFSGGQHATTSLATAKHGLCAQHSRGRFCARAQTDRDTSASVATQGSSEASTTNKNYATMTIEDLDNDYCDDFVCTSSPAIEQTVRALARDLARMKYTMRLFQPDVQYSDGFRSFKGSDKYTRPFWARDSVTDPRVRVTSMRMIDSGNAEIKWQLSGKVGMFDVSMPMTSTFQLNLVTGRVLQHSESWDLSGMSPPTAAAVVGSRMAWSAKQASQDAGEGLNKAAESLSSLTSMDDDQYYQNPTDPTKFFQNQDNSKNDAINIALVVAGLYLVYQVYSELEKLN